MRQLIILLVISIIAVNTQAQTFNEWFHQKKTRMNYLRGQLVQLIILERTIAEGYSIAKNGIAAIKQGKAAELLLHQNYYRSLGQGFSFFTN